MPSNSPFVAMAEFGSGSSIISPVDFSDLTDTTDFTDSDDGVRSLAVAIVVGVCSLLTFCLFIACGFLHCYCIGDKVTDLDSPVEYTEVKEHEVWINFDVLDELDPSIRANIDLDYLALLTNTDPALIEKYKVQQSLGNEEEDTMNQSWASSLNIHTLFSPARASVQGVHALVPLTPGTEAASGGHTPSIGLQRSATVRQKSLTNDNLGIKRVPTIADFSNLLSIEGGGAPGLNLSMTSHSGSNQSVADPGERKGSNRDDSLAVDLLRLLTIAKMGNSPKQGQRDHAPDHEGGGKK